MSAQHYTFTDKLCLGLYVLCYTLLLPFILLRLLYRSIKAPAYRQRIGERFGCLNDTDKGEDGVRYWVHAVSVGETVAAVPFIKKLIDKQSAEKSIYVTTTTVTGSQRVKTLLGDSVRHSYMPYDWPLFIALFIKRLRPKCLVIMETELWPITLYLCQHYGVRVIVANARLSDKSLTGYQRVKKLILPALKSVDLAVQAKKDADNFMALGVLQANIHITGNIKFDSPLAQDTISQAEQFKGLIEQYSARKIWIAASTHEGEDELLLHVHQKLLSKHADALLILVPRHPERFSRVAELAKSKMSCQLLSELGQTNQLSSSSAVLLGDKMGVLQSLYGLSQVAFIGGSLVPVGGHNMLEAAIWKLPIVTGPHRHNFLQVSDQLIAQDGLLLCQGIDDISQRINLYFDDVDLAKQHGDNAYQVVVNNQGALAKLMALV